MSRRYPGLDPSFRMSKADTGKPSNSSGKQKKKKWSKGKVKEKTNNAVIIDKATMDKLYKEVPTYKLITCAVLMDRMKINGSAARQVLAELETKGLIKRVHSSASLNIYTRATAVAEEAPAAKA